MNARRTAKIATIGLTLSLAAVGVTGCGGGGSKGSLKKFCSDYVTMANTSEAQNLVAHIASGDASLADPADKHAFKQLADGSQKLAKDAPADIRAEAQLSAKVLKEMASGKLTDDVDPGQTAGDHVDAYAQDHCPGATSAVSNGATATTPTTDAYSSNNSDSSSIDNGSSSSSSYSGDDSSTNSTCDSDPYGC
jgi:hypothetical protein